MVDFLCGATGGSDEHKHIISKIARVIIAGNSVAAPDRLQGELFGVRGVSHFLFHLIIFRACDLATWLLW